MYKVSVNKSVWQHNTSVINTFLLALVFAFGFGSSVHAQFRIDRPDFFERGQEQFELEIDRIEQQRPDSLPILDVSIDFPLWSAVVLREGGGVVWMPQGILSQETQTVESVDGNIDFDVISTTSALGRFVVAFSGAEDFFATAEPGDLLDRVRRRIMGDQTGFGVVSDRPITIENYPGQELVLQNEDEVITYRILLVENRLYVLAVNQSADSEHRELITTFFDSFQLL
ncbi:MAG: hypothetical protein AAGA75_21005 [Cyanobacteria bacterium P01_E01_bin.6]